MTAVAGIDGDFHLVQDDRISFRYPRHTYRDSDLDLFPASHDVGGCRVLRVL